MRVTCLLALVASASATYNLYYANFHSHTGYSDGARTPEAAFKYARDTAQIDILAVTDHAERLTSREWTDTKTQADSATRPGQFVGLAGFEWSSGTYGHANIFNTDDFCTSRTGSMWNPESLYAWLARRPGSIGQFNHIENTDFRAFKYSAQGDSHMALCEGQNWRRYPIGVLDKGWRVGMTWGQDNHQADWGLPKERTGIWAGALTEDSVLEAMRAMRTYLTWDKNVSLKFTSGNTWMGGTVTNGTIQFDVYLDDPDTGDWYTWVDLVSESATVVARLETPTHVNGHNHVEWHPTVTTSPGERSYFFISTYVNDTQPVVSTPIWTSPSATFKDVGIVGDLSPDGGLDSGSTLTPSCSVWNYGASAASYSVRMHIGYQYDTTVYVTNQPAGTGRRVSLRKTARFPYNGTNTATAWLAMSGDADTTNNTKTSTYNVGPIDAACVKILAPLDTIYSNTIVTPACTVQNNSVTAKTYTVRMKVGTTYNRTSGTERLDPGDKGYVTFPRCTLEVTGTYAVTCSTQLTADARPANNKETDSVVVVPGGFGFDGQRRDGEVAGKSAIAQGMSISPNPLASGFAALRYSLPKAGAAELGVYNMAGRAVMTQTLVVGRSGIVNLDLRHLSTGVYLVKFSSEGFACSQQLVLQR